MRNYQNKQSILPLLEAIAGLKQHGLLNGAAVVDCGFCVKKNQCSLWAKMQGPSCDLTVALYNNQMLDRYSSLQLKYTVPLLLDSDEWEKWDQAEFSFGKLRGEIEVYEILIIPGRRDWV